MIRALTILAAVAALAVTAAPIASAHREPDEAGNMEFNAKKPTPRGTAGCTLIGEIGFPKVAPASCCAGSPWPFMDYTDDSSMAKSKAIGLAKAKVPRRSASLSGGIPDGTSNTIGIASTRFTPKPRSLNTFAGTTRSD